MEGRLREAATTNEGVCKPCLTVNLVCTDAIDYYRSKPLSPGPIDVIVSHCKARTDLWVQLVPEPRGKKDTIAHLRVAKPVGDDLVFELDQVKRGPNHKLLIDQPDTKSYHSEWHQRICAELYDGSEFLCKAYSDSIRVSRERSRCYAKERKKRQHEALADDNKRQHLRQSPLPCLQSPLPYLITTAMLIRHCHACTSSACASSHVHPHCALTTVASVDENMQASCVRIDIHTQSLISEVHAGKHSHQDTRCVQPAELAEQPVFSLHTCSFATPHSRHASLNPTPHWHQHASTCVNLACCQ